jgi:hypothetical protein
MVKLFRKRHKSGDGEEEEELVLDTDTEEELVEEAAEAEPAPAAAAPPSDPLAQIRADADNETAAGKTPEGDAPPPQPDDSLDASLLELFREAKNEVEESTLASELADIPIQDLLSDLVSVSQELGVTPRAHPAASQRKTRLVDPEHDQGGK